MTTIEGLRIRIEVLHAILASDSMRTSITADNLDQVISDAESFFIQGLSGGSVKLSPTPECARESWLHQWVRRTDRVGIWHNTCCAGCGTVLGSSCFVFSEEEPPTPPDWPFETADCPVCYFRDQKIEEAVRLGHHGRETMIPRKPSTLP